MRGILRYLSLPQKVADVRAQNVGLQDEVARMKLEIMKLKTGMIKLDRKISALCDEKAETEEARDRA